MSILLRHVRVLRGGALSSETDVRIEAGVVAGIEPRLPPAASTLDLSGCILAPGFVDLHIHGANGRLCESGDPEAVRHLSELLPRYGVTGFLPTLAALAPEPLATAVAAIGQIVGHEPGARILGIHLEGPYLNPQAAGAQRPDWMRAPCLAELEELQRLAQGRIRLLTIAPELPGALDLIAAARRLGIRVSLGHTQASDSQMRAAIAAGASHVTHLFNAMRPLHHRQPGPVGVALTDDNLSVELIGDGYHVDPTVIRLAWRAKPADKIVAVTDAVALGATDGPCQLFGVECLVANGAIRLAGTDTLAGSCLSLDQAVRNLRQWIPEAPLERVIACASMNPRAVIGLGGGGGLDLGDIADLVILDTELRVKGSLCGGRPRFHESF